MEDGLLSAVSCRNNGEDKEAEESLWLIFAKDTASADETKNIADWLKSRTVDRGRFLDHVSVDGKVYIWAADLDQKDVEDAEKLPGVDAIEKDSPMEEDGYILVDNHIPSALRNDGVPNGKLRYSSPDGHETNEMERFSIPKDSIKEEENAKTAEDASCTPHEQEPGQKHTESRRRADEDVTYIVFLKDPKNLVDNNRILEWLKSHRINKNEEVCPFGMPEDLPFLIGNVSLDEAGAKEAAKLPGVSSVHKDDTCKAMTD